MSDTGRRLLSHKSRIGEGGLSQAIIGITLHDNFSCKTWLQPHTVIKMGCGSTLSVLFLQAEVNTNSGA